MTTTHILGQARIGAQRELKHALEDYWHGNICADKLAEAAQEIRRDNLDKQADLSFYTVGDFSLYDHVLDMSETLGNLPKRAQLSEASDVDNYFRAARGRSADNGDSCCGSHASEMTKWLDTNYHYIVPEFDKDTCFTLNPQRIVDQITEAKNHLNSDGKNIKPVILGPVSYLFLGKSTDNTDKLSLLNSILPAYAQLLDRLAQLGIEWIQIDEPALILDLSSEWQHAFRTAYFSLKSSPIKLLLTTYFSGFEDNFQLACELPVAGLHIDATRALSEVTQLADWLPSHKVLSVGVVDGRNIWKNDVAHTVDFLKPLSEKLGERLWVASSCSLLHVPIRLSSETEIHPEVTSWLAFGEEKITEVTLIGKALSAAKTATAIQKALTANTELSHSRKNSPLVSDPAVQTRLQSLDGTEAQRHSAFSIRQATQRKRLRLPRFPTTTIGSFPQTPEIRKTRSRYKAKQISKTEYVSQIRAEIEYCIKQQEKIGLDVLVHGEAERNDMVEYFGQQLNGFAFSQFGWVQSYGSRCVKPPIIFGDISRPQAMTTDWIKYAQSLTKKPVKGMLTGPVTILNWSFVRDDQPRSLTCLQIALAIRDEVLDLEKQGVSIIQIDEAALREGLPLRRNQWQAYLDWAIHAFKVTANGVQDQTQIHTHMCYSQFNDIIESIAAMDADVITIETSRSDLKLLEVFKRYQYRNEIGPGVYDIHSPNIPQAEHIIERIKLASTRLNPDHIWINPDCGLKTRQWQQVTPALEAMVQAAQVLRTA